MPDYEPYHLINAHPAGQLRQKGRAWRAHAPNKPKTIFLSLSRLIQKFHKMARQYHG